MHMLMMRLCASLALMAFCVESFLCRGSFAGLCCVGSGREGVGAADKRAVAVYMPIAGYTMGSIVWVLVASVVVHSMLECGALAPCLVAAATHRMVLAGACYGMLAAISLLLDV